MIRTLDQMVEKVLSLGKKYRIAVAWAHDPNTLGAINRAVRDGFAEAIMIGKSKVISELCLRESIDPKSFRVVDAPDESAASREAVRLTKTGEADVVMKGLVGTDKFLRSVMDKENGLMIPGAVLSYVCAIQVPAYHKLLLIRRSQWPGTRSKWPGSSVLKNLKLHL